MQSQHKKHSKMNKFKETVGSFKGLFRPGSRAPSPAPNIPANEGTTTPSIVVVATEAPTALVVPGAPVATHIGSQGPVSPVATPTQGLALSMDPQLANLPSISVDAVAGTGYGNVLAPTAPSSDATDHFLASKTKEGLGTAWRGFAMLLGKVESALDGTPFKAPVAAVNVLIQLGKAVSDNKDSLGEQIDGLATRLKIIEAALISDTDGVSIKMKEDFARLLIKQVVKLHAMSEQKLWKAILENEEDRGKLQKLIRDIDEHTKNFHLQVMLNIERNTSGVFKRLDQLQLAAWPRSRRAIYNADLEDEQKLSRGPCIPGTRVSILEDIYKWAQDSSSESPAIFWLTGQAGSGKSTIAYSVAQHFAPGAEGVPNILQATFFASRQLGDTRRKRFIIPSIVYQLARHSKSYAHALLEADKFDSVDIASEQMNDLLVDPWKKSAHKRSSDLPPYLVIIDALDEIDGEGGPEFLQELLKAIDNSSLKGLKFLVTSRPVHRLAQLCASFSSDAVCHLYDVAKEKVDGDIMLYLQAKLVWLQDKPQAIASLLRQADGLFIYASTAVRFISYPSGSTKKQQFARLSKLLESKVIKSSQVDSLYQNILLEAFSEFEDEDVKTLLKILHTMLCAEEPIST
ncbi:hypothetical protein C0991_006946, partial [Blastosporella zonata]